ncbi:hypothetical protein TSAR_004971 [Trichomalopsis sarcophagae]|uniref:Uncharacterized protein n=1 Tax=Trichomalopsis sarcophagae TaxID=543379 RepID=A0A232EIQ4_9HYME|nr:hypothetical protein TSAR_004971 [Trichomalopsis sarcophagae]
MQRETFTPRVPHNASEQLAKVKSNKNKRPEGILVKVGQNRTYAEVMGKVRRDVNPDITGAGGWRRPPKTGKRIRQDSVNCRTRKSSAGPWTDQKGRTEGHPRDKAHGPVSYEKRARALGKLDNGKRALLRPNTRGLRMAIVILSKREAKVLLEIEHIRVGLASCKIRKRVKIVWCHKCLGFGH